VVKSLCQYVKAEKYLQSALALANEIGDRAIEGRVYGTLELFFTLSVNMPRLKSIYRKQMRRTRKLAIDRQRDHVTET